MNLPSKLSNIPQVGKSFWITISLVLIVVSAVSLWSMQMLRNKSSSTAVNSPRSTQTVSLTSSPTLSPIPNLKVAFIGDQGPASNGSGTDGEKVLKLISEEKADLVIHLGDFDYDNDPESWDKSISDILGENYPYFATVGNHDVDGGKWLEYQKKLQTRLGKISGVACSGDLGVKSTCSFKGLFFVLSGIGTIGSGHEGYIEDELKSNANYIWKVCAWHKNQNAMQIGGKGNEVGWDTYEKCRENGAIIATAHEHSYERTKTLSNMQSQTVDPTCSDRNSLCVGKGKTFAFVAGLGGLSIRPQDRCLPSQYPYGCKGEWASIYTSNQEAKPGALFIEFNVDGQVNKAKGYFKNIDKQVVDGFEVKKV